jgi:hypothetical protein
MKLSKGYLLYTLVAVLIVALTFLPLIRRTFARSFPEGFQALGGSGADSRKGDCKGVTCNEGEFCQENVCRPVMAPITNDYFPDK